MAVPEHSHPGESQSDGKAERAVRAVIDQVRTMKLAFETRYKARLGSTHPIMLWLVEHASFLPSKIKVNTDGRTGWGRLHGRETKERICKFGECIRWYVPKRVRAKLDARWRHGLFLGRSMSSTSNFIGLRDGSIVRARAIVRFVPARDGISI